MRCRNFSWVLLIFTFLFLLILIPSTEVSSQGNFPTYPNLESFSIKSSPLESYTLDQGGGFTPAYHFPSLNEFNSLTADSGRRMNMTSGSFNLSGETGPEGNVTGSFNFTGYMESPWSTPDGESFIDLYEVSANGQITNAKAAFDENGNLRILGAAHYVRQFEYSGPVDITLHYNITVWDQEEDEFINYEGTLSNQAQLAFVSCISNLEDINLCHFETGSSYGDYGLEIGFINQHADDYVWHNNLDFEFSLISDINFDPEAHHDQEETEEEAPLFDESYLDAPQEAVEIADNPDAGFGAVLACNDQIYPDEGISCNLNISEGTENQPYTVNWIVDGYVVKSGTALLNQDSFVFPNPPPGSHSVQVQVIDQATYNARVSAANVEVLMPASLDKLTPWIQAMAGAGSVLILGTWLWSEWAAAKAKSDWLEKWMAKSDAALQQDRDAWYQQQMARNDELRAKQNIIEKYQAACEGEWKRFRNALLDTVNKYEKSEYLVDLYDDMYHDVYRDGMWDGKALQRLEELINTHLQMDRQHEAYSEWKRQLDFLNKRQQAFTDLMGSWTAIGAEVMAGVLTGGASEMIFMPTRAIGNALYASKRAELLGKTGWEAAKSVMIESGTKLGMDYIFSKAGEKIVGGLFTLGGKGMKRVIGQEGMEAVGEWWQRTAARFGKAPTPDMELPVIKQNWGRGPQVFVNKPIFKPGTMPPVNLGMEGMERYMNQHIRPLNSALADDLADLYRAGVDIDPRMNNILKAGQSYSQSISDEVAVKIMNNPAYKQAVREGLVPASAQQAVYQARDKFCKNAMREVFEQMDHYVINGKPASKYIHSVAITGTGAKPLSPQAIGRYTDFDSTVIGGSSLSPGEIVSDGVRQAEQEAARRAEQLYMDLFDDYIRRSGINPSTAEINMFPGVHEAGELARGSGGYISEPMIHWQKVDMINRGRTAVRSPNGSVIFDNHPDVMPVEGFGPLDPTPHFPLQPDLAAADARGVILNHVTQAVHETGENMTQSAILRQEGKHAMRVWKTVNAGSGRTPPNWIKRLEELKRNPDSPLTSTETAELWQEFSDFLGLPPNIGE